jgi:hypothetical protein
MIMALHVVVLVGLCGLGAADASAEELLTRCEAALDTPRQISFDAEMEVEWTEGDPESQETRHSLYRCRFRRDGERLEADVQGWLLEDGKDVEGRPPFRSYHSVWSDGRYVHYQRARADGRPAGGATSARADFATRSMMGALKDGKVLEGYLPGDGEIQWTAIFRKASQVEVAPGRDKVDEAPCIRMRCQTEHGVHTVWIDPEADYRARRIEVVRSGENLLSGKPLTAYKAPTLVAGIRGPIREHRVVVEKVKLESIGQQWIPVGVEIHDSLEYANGAFYRSHTRQTRKNIRIGAEAIPPEAFMLLDTPEGMRFDDQDEKGVFFVWQNGELVRHVLEGAELVPEP